MSQSRPSAEGAILQLLLPNLEAEGFRVLLHPPRSMLPPFMADYRPDAIALKDGRKLAIEVTPRTTLGARPTLAKLQTMFSDHPDWELRVIYAPPLTPEAEVTGAPPNLIADTLARLPPLYKAAGPLPALLTGWSAFEAAARSLLPPTPGRTRTPAQVLERLAADGSITPDEADMLRSLEHERRRAGHGQLDVSLTPEQLDELIAVTQTLLALHQDVG